MTDRIEQAARNVRGITRGHTGVHQLLATIEGGRACRTYRTACHRELPAHKAALTTAPADCADCKAANG